MAPQIAIRQNVENADDIGRCVSVSYVSGMVADSPVSLLYRNAESVTNTAQVKGCVAI